jgi:hypothetical protein
VAAPLHSLTNNFATYLQADAQVEITAKVFHGYNAGEAYKGIDKEELMKTKGREYGYNKDESGTKE